MEDKLLRYWLVSIAILIFVLALPDISFAQSSDFPVPEGFYLVTSSPGVDLYRKDYSGGSPDFVQVLNLSQGAKMVPMHGDIVDSRQGKGSYGGDDASLTSQSIQKYWQELSANYGDAFCVLNGQFFYMQESPTRLPFPLKVDNEIVSEGYGLNEFPDNKLLLELWPNKARIITLTYQSLYGSDAPDIIAGLTQTANKRSDRYVGRTFVGVDDRNQDGDAEILLVFNSKISRQVDAASVLHSFGADKVMMLDGGGSTQLTCLGEALVSSDRPIPQAIGVVASSEAIQDQQESAAAAALEEITTSSPADDASASQSDAQFSAGASSRPDQLEFGNVIWVPLMMTPVIAILAIFVNRLRSNIF
jgi:hypothetical protein